MKIIKCSFRNKTNIILSNRKAIRPFSLAQMSLNARTLQNIPLEAIQEQYLHPGRSMQHVLVHICMKYGSAS